MTMMSFAVTSIFVGTIGLGLGTQIGCGKRSDSEPAPSPTTAAGTKAAPAAAKAALIPERPLIIAYSDWPGWVAWDIGVVNGFFVEEGVSVEFKWFEYVPSMEAFTAGKVDAVTMTNGDALVTGSSGVASRGILLNDFSNGNDMVVARPGIATVADLKGKTVGVEVGFVSHLLLMNALAKAGLSDKDITIVNLPTDQTPQALKSGRVDAIAAWQPNSGQALRELPGSKAIFTSADVPGIIYDLLYVSPKSLAENREAWKRVVKVWFRIADYIAAPETRAQAVSIMSARVRLQPEAYRQLMDGTHFLDLAGNLKHFARGDTLTSVYFSSDTVDKFNLKHGVYKAPVAYESYLDPSLVQEIAAERGRPPASK